MRGHACACPFLDLAGEKFNLFSSAQMKIYAAKYVSSWLLLQEVPQANVLMQQERQWLFMNRNDFIAKADEWMCRATGGALGFSDNDLFIIEHEDAPGDFIFENEDFVAGKYYYQVAPVTDLSGEPLPIDITSEELQNPKRCLNFYIVGVGRKYYVTRTEYELDYYDSVDYEIITAEEFVAACAQC